MTTSAQMRQRLPSPRRRAYVRVRADQLQEENSALGLPHAGGFIRGMVELEAESERQSLLSGSRTQLFNSMYYLLGLPAAVLAAVAGATALASTAGRIAAGVIALTAAALSAAVAFLDAGKQREKSGITQSYWDDLYNDIHVARLTQLERYTTESGPHALTVFYSRASSIRAGRDPANDARMSAVWPTSDSDELLFRQPAP